MFACIYSQQIPAEVSLADFAYAFSPLVEETARDTVVIDVEGARCALGRHMNSPMRWRNRHSCGRKQADLVAKSMWLWQQILMPPSTQRKYFQGVTFISPGEELTALGELPIEKLSIRVQRSKVQRPKSNVKYKVKDK